MDVSGIHAGGSNQKSKGRVGILDGEDRAESLRHEEVRSSIAIVDHQG